MSTLIILLSLCLVTSHSLGVEYCKIQPGNEIPTTSAPEEENEFKLTADENGTKVEERIRIDEKKQTEKFHVPAHNDKDEADIIFDFKQNLAMYRLPQRKICFLLALDPIIPSPKKLSQSLHQKSSGKAEPTTEIKREYERIGEVKDRTILSDDMAAMCAKFPIYRVEPVKPSVTIARARSRRDARLQLNHDKGCCCCCKCCCRVSPNQKVVAVFPLD